ncbi:MAG: Xanthan lyase precursor [candidate division BRC1 bacterium ADurb.Bin183]|nr:MAG: Xanthan lyase precursor [candidate division BRC1 bacterium ADurb.Bin183]
MKKILCCRSVQSIRYAAMLAVLSLMTCLAHAAYFPNMVYGAKTQIAPGVTWQRATNPSPAQRIVIIEVDMTNRNVELVPVFKAAGNVANSSNEKTSSMAARSDAVAAINAGYYHITAGDGYLMTNSYVEIDGVFIGGTNSSMKPENNRSVLGFSGNHHAIAKRTKLNSSFVPADPTDWDKIVDAIGGRGHFITSGGVVITQDNEGTSSSHYDSLNPRTLIGYKASPYKVYLVTVDGRQSGVAEGMTYTQLAQLMADLGVEQSISLDGGGSTTAWIKGSGVVNTPSDGSERSVVTAWCVLSANTMDNTVEEVEVTGSWATDTLSAQKYYLDQLITDNTAGAASVKWTPNLAEDGLYKVYAWWTSEPGRATAAPYEIVHANGTSTMYANQTTKGGKWNLLGIFPFHAGAGGSVTLRNTATGTISADAVRFVRISAIPAPITPGYIVTGNLYQTDFETDVSSDFNVSQHIAGDNSINFSYDYSTFSQQGGGFPTSIPQSPGSTGAGTKALRMAVNLNNGVVNGITATLAAITPPGRTLSTTNMRITFDAWINYNGGVGGGTGSTEWMTFGGSADPARVAMANSDYAGANQPFSGFYFAISGEGGSSTDYRYYDGNGTGGATGNNAARANYLGNASVNSSSFSSIFPEGEYETSGAPGKAWNKFEIVSLNGKLRLLVTRPDGFQILLCDWFTPNTSATLTGLLPHFGTMDLNAGVASPGQDNFVLYDNLKVDAIAPTPPSNIDDWGLY